jgi:hypothetical protein
MRRLGLAVVVALAAVAGLAQPAAPARPGLQRILDGLVSGTGRIAPGATAYVYGPHGVWVGAAGVADVKTGERMKPDARMRLESVSKAWTAVLMLQLVTEHKLGLADTVSRRLPGLLPYGSRITLRELLDHTSGMIDTNDIARDPARYIAKVKDPALRARLTALYEHVKRDPAYEFSPRLWVDFATTRTSATSSPASSRRRWAVRAWPRSSAAGSSTGSTCRRLRTTRMPRSPGRTSTGTASPRTERSPTPRAGRAVSAPTAASCPTPGTRRGSSSG